MQTRKWGACMLSVHLSGSLPLSPLPPSPGLLSFLPNLFRTRPTTSQGRLSIKIMKFEQQDLSLVGPLPNRHSISFETLGWLLFPALATWCEELTHLKRPWCWDGHEFEQALGVGDGQGSLYHAAVHGVVKSWTWTEKLKYIYHLFLLLETTGHISSVGRLSPGLLPL